MLDYKTIIIKRYALNLSGTQIARDLGCSKSGANDFLKRFEGCKTINFPLPDGIANYGIAELVYGKVHGQGIRNETFVLPDYAGAHQQMTSRKNMTPIYQWDRYKKKCEKDNLKHYSYRQFCGRYGMWYDDNEEDAVGILEKGFFHDLEDRKYFSLEQFNEDLWYKLGLPNQEKIKMYPIDWTV